MEEVGVEVKGGGAETEAEKIEEEQKGAAFESEGRHFEGGHFEGAESDEVEKKLLIVTEVTG